MKLNTQQRLLNEHEVAESCSISVLTLRKWRSQKRGPQYVKIGAQKSPDALPPEVVR